MTVCHEFLANCQQRLIEICHGLPLFLGQVNAALLEVKEEEFGHVVVHCRSGDYVAILDNSFEVVVKRAVDI